MWISNLARPSVDYVSASIFFLFKPLNCHKIFSAFTTVLPTFLLSTVPSNPFSPTISSLLLNQEWRCRNGKDFLVFATVVSSLLLSLPLFLSLPLCFPLPPFLPSSFLLFNCGSLNMYHQKGVYVLSASWNCGPIFSQKLLSLWLRIYLPLYNVSFFSVFVFEKAVLVSCNFTTVFANLDFLKKLHKGKRLCELLSFATSILISLVTNDAALDPPQDFCGMQVGASFSMLHFPYSHTQCFSLIC